MQPRRAASTTALRNRQQRWSFLQQAVALHSHTTAKTTWSAALTTTSYSSSHQTAENCEKQETALSCACQPNCWRRKPRSLVRPKAKRAANAPLTLRQLCQDSTRPSEPSPPLTAALCAVFEHMASAPSSRASSPDAVLSAPVCKKHARSPSPGPVTRRAVLCCMLCQAAAAQLFDCRWSSMRARSLSTLAPGFRQDTRREVRQRDAAGVKGVRRELRPAGPAGRGAGSTVWYFSCGVLTKTDHTPRHITSCPTALLLGSLPARVPRAPH
jgi:hypothetical protein